MVLVNTVVCRTSNMTGHHRGPKRKLWAGYGVPSQNWMCLLCAVSHIFVHWSATSVRDILFFSAECGIAQFLCAMRVLKKFGHHPHPLGYLCAKFCFFCGPHCWARLWRKSIYSFTQSLNHPDYLMCREPKLSLRNKQWNLRGLTFGAHCYCVDSSVWPTYPSNNSASLRLMSDRGTPSHGSVSSGHTQTRTSWSRVC